MVIASPVPEKKSFIFNCLLKTAGRPGGTGRQDSALRSAENAGNTERQAGPPASGVNFNATPFMQ
jgi:hypothetical protein